MVLFKYELKVIKKVKINMAYTSIHKSQESLRVCLNYEQTLETN